MLSARRAAGLVAASVPAVVVGGSSWYREKHRPELPPHTLRDLSGEVVVVTGATSGIGKAVAGKLAGLGATVVVGSRDQGRGEAARQGILASVGGTLPAPRCEVLPLDLSDLDSVRTFADECRRRHAGNISVVVAVAAEIVYEEGRQAASGADLSFATNQLGLQALLAELEPELGSSPRRGASGLRANRRVVIVGSRLEARGSVDPESAGLPHGRRGREQRLFTATAAHRRWSIRLAVRGSTKGGRAETRCCATRTRSCATCCSPPHSPSGGAARPWTCSR